MRHSFNQRLAILLVVVTAVPCRGYAAGSAETAGASQPVIRDVELGYGGVAQGLVVDANGAAAANVDIELHTSGKVIHATSDAAGKFSVSGVEGGPCIVKVGQVPYGCRMWETGTAPPKSLQSFAVVHKTDASVRAQSDACDSDACDAVACDGGCDTDACDGVGAAGKSHLCSLSGMSTKQVALVLGIAAAATVAIILAVQDEGDASL